MSSEEPFSTWKQLCGSSSVVSLWPQLHQLFFYYPHLFFLVLHQPAHFHGGGTALDFHWKRRHIKEDSNRSSVAMAQQNKLMTGKYTNLVSQRGLPCDKHTKRKRPLSRRIYPAQQRGSAGTGNRWKVSSFHQHIVLPPPVSFWSFHYKSDSFFFSSLFQESLVIIIKKTNPDTLYSSFQAFSRIFDFQGSVALSSSDPVWWGADRENDLGDESASSFRERIVVLSCKTSRIPTSLQRSYVLVSLPTIPGTCVALGQSSISIRFLFPLVLMHNK